MKNNWTKIAALFIVFAMTFSVAAAGCMGGQEETPKNETEAGEDSDADGVPDAEDRWPGYDDNKFSQGPVVLGMTDEPKRLNPLTWPDVYSNFVLTQIYNPLLRTNPTGKVNTGGKALATDYKIGEDGLTYTFQIEEGVKFHNGEELTAEDVVFSFRSILKEELGSPRRQEMMTIESVNATGEYEVTVKLKHLDAPFLYKVASNIFVVPKDYVQENGWEYLRKHPMGSGPYKFVEYKTGSHILLERNEDYWGKPAYINQTKFKFYPERSTSVMALQQGEIHFMERMSPDQWRQLKEAPGVVAKSHPKMAFWPLQFNQKKPPFNNVKVRKALAYAIDSEEVIAGVRGKELADNTRSPVPPIHPAHADVSKYEYDPEKAKQLLEEAGYPDGIDTTVYVTPGSVVRECQLIAEQAKKAGFDIEIKKLEWGTFLDAVQAGEAPLWYSGWTGGASGYSLLNLFHSESTWNWYVTSNSSKFDETFDEAIKTPDREKRFELYRECQKILVEEEMGVYISYTRYARKAHREELVVPEDSWNPYMGAGPLIRVHEWYLKE